MEEIWQEIKEFNRDYLISNLGRLKSVERVVKHPKGTCILKEKFLSQVKNKKGYIEFQITYNKKHYSRKAHRLVAQAFIPNIENKPHINHINGDKSDNRVENLEWVFPIENNLHAIKNELKPTKHINQYDLNGNYIQTFNSIKQVSKELNGQATNIVKALKGKTKSAYGYKWEYA